MGVFDIALLPDVHLFDAGQAEGVFPRTVLLILSNPLTIVFWAGVFSTKLAEDGMSRRGMLSFGIGAVLATLSFLGLIALLGSLTQRFFPEVLMQGLNMAVGVLLVFFGLRPLVEKGA
jgi:threonine/homoserine/homoserine lactone efflux protein